MAIIRDKKTGTIKGLPIGEASMSHKPICVNLPLEDDEFVRSLPNRSAFIREAIREAILKAKKSPD
jgi:hypothetical protein